MSESDYNQWSTVRPYFGTLSSAAAEWIPKEDRDRLAAYLKYDEMYWNDGRQYALRVLEGEQPLYIPNARMIVDTTAHYLLKGLEITAKNDKTKTALDAFMKRERFYSKFHAAKQAGVGRGDFVFHVTADPNKAPGTRLSIESVYPGSVFPIWDEFEPTKMVGCHITVQFDGPLDQLSVDDKPKTRIRRLTYKYVGEGESRRIEREEVIYQLEPNLFGNERMRKIKTVLPKGLLDSRIKTLPIYWFRNRSWDGEEFGSSELRGIEAIAEVVSQGSTDVSSSLSLEGLGVYATDGGRPVDEDGNETDWEVAPGKVMEVPTGSYFRRVEGVTSITPATDQIKYLESKIYDAVGLSDVALGKVDAQVAASGIALAIKFLPTMAKIEVRDQLGIDILTQLFFDWKTWHEVFEQELLEGDIIPVIGDKLPTDRLARVNELNNMLDRKVISTQFYRDEMKKLGYEFPANIETQLAADAEKLKLATAQPVEKDSPDDDEKSTDGDTVDEGNQSNNKNRPNESSGTEAVNKTRDA